MLRMLRMCGAKSVSEMTTVCVKRKRYCCVYGRDFGDYKIFKSSPHAECGPRPDCRVKLNPKPSERGEMMNKLRTNATHH